MVPWFPSVFAFRCTCIKLYIQQFLVTSRTCTAGDFKMSLIESAKRGDIKASANSITFTGYLTVSCCDRAWGVLFSSVFVAHHCASKPNATYYGRTLRTSVQAPYLLITWPHSHQPSDPARLHTFTASATLNRRWQAPRR